MRKSESPTSLGMLLRCGQQYRWRYIEGVRRPPGIALLVGGAVHEAAELSLLEKIAGNPLPPLGLVQEAAAASLAKRWDAEGAQLDDGQDEATARGEATDEAVSLAGAHLVDIAPAIEPARLEAPWEIDIGLPWTVNGRIDVVDRQARLRDLKTGVRRPDPNGSWQLAWYALALQYSGSAPQACGFDFLRKGTGRSRGETIWAAALPSADESSRLVRRAEAAALVIEAGAFAPAPEGAWWCSARFCGFHHAAGGPCKFGQ